MGVPHSLRPQSLRGKDVCAILDFKDVKITLRNQLEKPYKTYLKLLADEISTSPVSYYAGKAVPQTHFR